MSNFELVILGIFDVMGYLLISLSLLKKEKIDKKRRICFFVFATIGMAAITIIFPREYAIMLNFVNFYINTLVFIEKKWKESLLIFSLSMSILFATQLPLILLLNFMNADIQRDFFVGLISQSFFLGIYFLIYKKITVYVLWEYTNKNFRVFFITIINMMLIGLCTVIFYSLDVERFIELILFFLTISCFFLAVNVILINQSLKNKYQNEMQRKQFEYNEMISSLVDEIKQVQHEYDNHIQGLKISARLYKDGSEKDIANYIDDIEEKQWFRNLLKLLNPVLMGVVITKYRKALEKKIKFEVRNHNDEMLIPIEDYELTEIVGILSDNAIENTEEYGTVIVEFQKNGLLVKNSHEYLSGEIINKMFAKGYSTKGAGSGIGLYNLKKIVDKYHGQIEVYNEKSADVNYVVFKISF